MTFEEIARRLEDVLCEEDYARLEEETPGGEHMDNADLLRAQSYDRLVTLLIEADVYAPDSVADWDEVKRSMDAPEWEENDDGDMTRRVFLGTVFTLTPSGKYYQPFACSNVEDCPVCNGAQVYGVEKCSVCRGTGIRGEHPDDDVSKYPLVTEGEECHSCDGHGFRHSQCEYCGGSGSREAYLDTLYFEYLEEQAASRGYHIENGEGDPCDIFVVEFREG